MNNKLFKRIVAAAASAVMLGSCAFATTLSNVSYDGSADNGVLSFTYNNGAADKVTYVAYAATRATDTDTNAVTVNGTKYVLGEMVAINQLDNLAAATADAAGTPETVPVDKTKLANADAIVLKSGDSLGSAVAVEAVALQTTPDYTTKTENVTYNGIAGTIVRVYGLDATKVVTVDGVTAKYYQQRNASGELTGKIVHVACVAQNAKPAITVAEGTPVEIKFGDVNKDGTVNFVDANEIAYSYGGKTITGRNGSKKYSLPNDLMELMVFDINADGTINSVDANETAYSFGGKTITGRNGSKKYSLNTMPVLLK